MALWDSRSWCVTPRSGALWYQADSGGMASRKDYPSIGNRGRRTETARCLCLLLFLQAR